MLNVITDVLQSSTTTKTSTSKVPRRTFLDKFKNFDMGEAFKSDDLGKTDFFDFVTSAEYNGRVERPPDDLKINSTNSEPLERYEQFWVDEKEPKHLESALFEDLNRYCWNQQQSNNCTTNNNNERETIIHHHSSANGKTNTDQVYTLTVLNGPSAEPSWMGRETNDKTIPAIDFETILSGYPGYIKSECFNYDDSGFGTDNTKEDILINSRQHANNQHILPTVLPNIESSNSLETGDVIPYQSTINNNNNETSWHLLEPNVLRQTPASMLRSALQGKSYTKGMVPMQQTIKEEADEVRRALYVAEPELLAFTDPSLNSPVYIDDHHQNISSPNHLPPPQTQQSKISQHASVLVDDMFLTLDPSYTDDYEKLKRITSEVQQFCNTASTIDHSNYSDIMINEAAANNNNNLSIVNNNHSMLRTSDVTTTFLLSSSPATTKKYNKKDVNNKSNNNNCSATNNLNHSNNSNTQTKRKERSLHYCSICSKGFKDKYSVNVHVRTHTGEKPFVCTLCGKNFRQRAHLAKHYQTHIAQKATNSKSSGKRSTANTLPNANNDTLGGYNNTVQPQHHQITTIQLSQPVHVQSYNN